MIPAASDLRTISIVLAALFDLDTPTHLVFHWGWLLVTSANFAVYVGLVLVFVLAITVRLPGAKRDLARVAERDATDGEEQA